MQVFTEVGPLINYLQGVRSNNKTIGLVPTMGALHEGHNSLIAESLKSCDITVCSVYVNPTQFNTQSDLDNYPRKLDEDMAFLKKNGCDVLFAPADKEMYVTKPVLNLDFGALEQSMEGKFRPGHFNGVGVIVGKLFNIVRPHRAYFGQKDIQQYFIIKQLVRDLSYQIELVKVPTVREDDGLAMSSRNQRLSPELRSKAPLIYQALEAAGKMLREGKEIAEVRENVRELFLKDHDFKLEYFEVVDHESLEVLQNRPVAATVVLCIAVHLGEIRLIDNIYLFF